MPIPSSFINKPVPPLLLWYPLRCWASLLSAPPCHPASQRLFLEDRADVAFIFPLLFSVLWLGRHLRPADIALVWILCWSRTSGWHGEGDLRDVRGGRVEGQKRTKWIKTGMWDCTKMLQTLLLSICAENSQAVCETLPWLHLPFISLNYSLFYRKNRSFEHFSTPQHTAEFIKWLGSIKSQRLPALSKQWVPSRKLPGDPLSCQPLEGLECPRDSLGGVQQCSPLILSAFHPNEFCAVAGRSGTSQVENTLGSSLFFSSLWNTFIKLFI